jgi:hypothetical protein
MSLNKITHNDLGYLYRYVLVEKEAIAGLPDVNLTLQEYPIIKITPKGYWIKGIHTKKLNDFFIKKWVSNDGLRRFAYDTKELAINNYIKRTEKRIKILTYQLTATKLGLYDAKNLQHEKTPSL